MGPEKPGREDAEEEEVAVDPFPQQLLARRAELNRAISRGELSIDDAEQELSDWVIAHYYES